MSAIARDAGLKRGNLYEPLSEDGNRTLSSLLRITRYLRLMLNLAPVENTGQIVQPNKRRNFPA